MNHDALHKIERLRDEVRWVEDWTHDDFRRLFNRVASILEDLAAEQPTPEDE